MKSDYEKRNTVEMFVGSALSYVLLEKDSRDLRNHTLCADEQKVYYGLV